MLEDDYQIDLKALPAAIQRVPRDWDVIRFNCWGPVPASFMYVQGERNETAVLAWYVVRPGIFRTSHSNVGRCKGKSAKSCGWFCGGTHAVVWRESSLAKLRAVWGQRPADGVDCRLTTEKLVSYCVNGVVEGSFLEGHLNSSMIPK